MKDTFFIIVFGVLIYLGFSTLLGGSELMGIYGTTFSKFNQLYFGYISFVYLFILLLPLYFLYRSPSFDFRKSELMVASFLLLCSSLLAQALLVNNTLRGKFGGDFVDFLSPYIGSFGLWVFWFIISAVSLLIVLDKTTSEVTKALYKIIRELFSLKPLSTPAVTTFHENAAVEVPSTVAEDNIPATVEENKQADLFEETLTQEYKTEDNDGFKIEDHVDIPTDDILEIEKPSYLRKMEKPQSNQESKNILDLVVDIKEHKNAVVVEELEENAKLLASIEKGKVEKPKNFKLPPVDFLQKPTTTAKSIDESEVDEKIQHLIGKLAHFKIDGDVVRTYAGPVVSTFEFKPAANVKVSKILNLQDDLAMALSAETIRIQAPIPGKDVVGIEIPNESFDTIYLREILDDKLFKDSSSPLTMALGKDIVGKPFITDLKKLPHLLIAGTTGSGKSVGINAMILSLLYKN